MKSIAIIGNKRNVYSKFDMEDIINIVFTTDDEAGPSNNWNLTFNDLLSLLDREINCETRCNPLPPKDADAKIENKETFCKECPQLYRILSKPIHGYALKYDPSPAQEAAGAYKSKCCGGCKFEHEDCAVREYAKGDHSCSYKQEKTKDVYIKITNPKNDDLEQAQAVISHWRDNFEIVEVQR
jgi:hypothetical protein